MRRILALVCIFILLLFTGIPMFTSNLLCNKTNVYADTLPEQWQSDRAKAIAGLSVFLNDHKGFLYAATGNNNVDVDKFSMYLIDGFVLPFLEYYRFEQQTISALSDLAEYITIENDPFIVRMFSPAVSFYNAFLQWMLDNGKITNNPSGNDNLYNGYNVNGKLVWVIPSSAGNTGENTLYDNSILSKGYDYGLGPEQYYNLVLQSDPTWNRLNNSGVNPSRTMPQTGYYDIEFNANYTYQYQIYYSSDTRSNTSSLNQILPNIVNNRSSGTSTAARTSTILYCNNGLNFITGYFGILYDQYHDVFKYVQIGINNTTNKFSYYTLHGFTVDQNSNPLPTNIGMNKDDFDSSPTTPPSGSDGFSYQPRQNGTGNTYNNYNNYYNDYHEGDTYIYHPSDSGGGGGDNPGGGGEDPTPGGTTPPWDGSGSDGLYSQGGTLTPDGNGGYNLNFPDVGLPDLNIDWSINGLKEKFPFSIPWDLMAFFAVMNAEPETPEIQATIPLGLWEWDIDWDLHAFDNVARILRNMELIGFCIGLILITRSIIKG